MPTFRDVITGLTIGTTLAGGIVALGAIASTTAANATVVQGQFDDGDGLLGFARRDGNRRDLRTIEDLILLRNLNVNTAAGLTPVRRVDENAVNIINSFNRQFVPQRLRERNQED
ncbi:hypothetical protein [Sphaerimonospora mesophila]|uniref:hypothetical protein n=1 Tax=Sphaerimonospora mesophila TaxID=37483 RepID=UPI0006E3D703